MSSPSQSIFAPGQGADLLVLMQFATVASVVRPRRVGRAGVEDLARELPRLSRHIVHLRERPGHGDGPGDGVLDRLHSVLAEAGPEAQREPAAQTTLVDAVTDLVYKLLACSRSARR